MSDPKKPTDPDRAARLAAIQEDLLAQSKITTAAPLNKHERAALDAKPAAAAAPTEATASKAVAPKKE